MPSSDNTENDLTGLSSTNYGLAHFPGSTFSVLDTSEETRKGRGDGTISIDRLYDLGEDGGAQKTQTASFVSDCNDAFFSLTRVSNISATGTAFEADLEFIEAKKRIYTLAKHRSMSEGVTMVIWWLIKIARSAPVATEGSEHLSLMKSTLQFLKRSPNLDFASAMGEVDRMESALGAFPAPSYGSIASLILDEDGASGIEMPQSMMSPT